MKPYPPDPEVWKNRGCGASTLVEALAEVHSPASGSTIGSSRSAVHEEN
ncbi:hypothetical protein [Umezawaea sp. Da 62-37]|nr:hypothetical protein [Umezawaea sp. Da 62-37]WNV86016.1 hypothetical protein RM788_49210 [Umezawaea sp. Da 62-37]